MPTIHQPYWAYPRDSKERPLVPAMATNIRNGASVGFVGLLDTGADITTLTEDLLANLRIDPSTLPLIEVGGVHSIASVPFCSFIRISLVEFPSMRLYSPNGDDPVPLQFSQSPFCLLGRESFLDLCDVTFSGPRRTVTIDL